MPKHEIIPLTGELSSPVKGGLHKSVVLDAPYTTMFPFNIRNRLINSLKALERAEEMYLERVMEHPACDHTEEGHQEFVRHSIELIEYWDNQVNRTLQLLDSTKLLNKNLKYIKTTLIDNIQTFGVFTGKHDNSYTLSSGTQSKHFIDMSKVFGRTSNLQLAVVLAADIIYRNMDLHFDVFGGPANGAIPLAVQLAQQFSCFWVTMISKGKEFSINNISLEGAYMYGGYKIILIDDVTTTGNSLHTCISALKERSIETVAIISVVDRGALPSLRFNELEIPYYPLITHQDLEIEPVTI